MLFEGRGLGGARVLWRLSTPGLSLKGTVAKGPLRRVSPVWVVTLGHGSSVSGGFYRFRRLAVVFRTRFGRRSCGETGPAARVELDRAHQDLGCCLDQPAVVDRGHLHAALVGGECRLHRAPSPGDQAVEQGLTRGRGAAVSMMVASSIVLRRGIRLAWSIGRSSSANNLSIQPWITSKLWNRHSVVWSGTASCGLRRPQRRNDRRSATASCNLASGRL